MAIAAQVTTTATTSWTTRFADSWRTDLMAVVAMLVPGVLAFGPVFGGMAGYVAAGGGVLLGLAIALLSRWRGWSWVTTTVAAVAAYLVCGGALALPRTTMGGVVPTVDTLRRLVLLTVQSWRDLLTVSLPAASFTGPAVVPLLSGIVLALLAVLAGTRTARSALAVAPCALLLVVGILWGIHTAPYAVAQGLLFAMIALVWQSARARRRDAALAIDLLGDAADSPRRPRRSFLSAAIVVAACALIAGLAAGLGAPLSRFVLRDTIEPPLDLKQFASPLTMFRSFERDLKDETLMTVTGLPAGARLRLATVDAYDGVVYNVDVASAGFHPVGTTIESETQSAAPVTTLGVTVGSYQGLWLPGGGDVRAVRFSEADSQSQAERLYYNPTTGTALTTVGVAKGAAYQIDVALPPKLDEGKLGSAPLASVTLPGNTKVPESVSATAADFIGSASSPLEQVRSLEQKLKETGFFSDGSDGKSRAGETAERITTLLTAKQMIGDDEQYAVAMALMARQLGMPARVVIGFYPAADAVAPSSGQELAIKGSDAHVWTEVAFDGMGWVPFDPTPKRDKTPQTDVPKPRNDPKPQVLQPPPPVIERPDPSADIIGDQRKTVQTGESPWLRIAVMIAAGVGILGVLALPFVTVLLLKRRRRRRRREETRLVDRASGSWAEIVDSATDLGTVLQPRVTRREAATALATAYPEADCQTLADAVDRSVFGQGEPTEADIERMWGEVDGVLASMHGSVGRLRRLRARLSPRSLGLNRRQLKAALSPGTLRKATSGGLARIRRQRKGMQQ